MMLTLSEQIQMMNRFFYSRKTYDLSFRLHFLKKLQVSITDHQKEILNALKKDFNKPKFETYTTEIYTVLTELKYTLKHLKSWAKPQSQSNYFSMINGHTQLYNEPYGICAIYIPFNYPFQLAMMPLIGAISAGNCAVLKPSPFTPYTNAVIQTILEEVFPPYYVTILDASLETSKALPQQPIDYIFFTGGFQTGQKIMRAASERLIPITLELGGKSPAIVDYDANLKLAAKRIVWGKFLNAGQTCVAPDYVLVHESVAQKFLDYVGFALNHFYQRKNDMAHIINESRYVHLLKLIDEDHIYYGGHFNTDELYIEPTVLYPVSLHDACMKEEIFGPILPIIPYKQLSQVIRTVQHYPKPLALYLFGKNVQRREHLLKHLSFGGGCINDTIVHTAKPSIPFGGVGFSGIGSYHGYASFKTFSHQKSIFYSSACTLALRYPPYQKHDAILKKILKF